jgi:hypothetical protein
LIQENKLISTELEKLPAWLGGPKVIKQQKQETLKNIKTEVSSEIKSARTLGKVSNLTNAQFIISNYKICSLNALY